MARVMFLFTVCCTLCLTVSLVDAGSGAGVRSVMYNLDPAVAAVLVEQAFACLPNELLMLINDTVAAVVDPATAIDAPRCGPMPTDWGTACHIAVFMKNFAGRLSTLRPLCVAYAETTGDCLQLWSSSWLPAPRLAYYETCRARLGAADNTYLRAASEVDRGTTLPFNDPLLRCLRAGSVAIRAVPLAGLR